MQNQKNILFIILDQLRADCVFGALSDNVDMPHIRALMADAVTFKQFYSVTNPCGPARASILTGQYAFNHRSVRNGTPLAHDIPNVATEIRKVGYEPMLFGYTDTSLDPGQYHANDPKLTTYEEVMPGFNEKLEMRFEYSFPWRASLKAKGYDIPEYKQFYNPVTADGQQPQLNDPAFYAAQDSDSAFLTDCTLAELSVRQDQNWFAHVTYIRPHPPWVAPEPFNQMYKAADCPPPNRKDNVAEELAIHPFFAPYIDKFKNYNLIHGPLSGFDKVNDDDAIQAMRALYFGLITEVDQQIGRLIEQLKQNAQYDNTLIVIQADHGEMLGDHHMWGKQTIYDQAFHVPLIIRDPSQPQMHGTSVDDYTESVDIAPTILDWVGSTPPSSMDGHSLLPFLRGEKPTNWREHIFCELDFSNPTQPQFNLGGVDIDLHNANVSILRDQQYRLVHFNAGLPPLLFDIIDDPNEMDNLANDPEFSHILLQMTQKLLNHRMRHANRTLSNVQITKNGAIQF